MIYPLLKMIQPLFNIVTLFLFTKDVEVLDIGFLSESITKC